MAVRISRALLGSILSRCARDAGREVCGLLLGRNGIISEILAAENVARDPTVRFEIDPAVLIAAPRAARAGGTPLMGHYHSHPGGGVAPAVCDAEMAMEQGQLWLICVPDGRHALWRSGTSGVHGRFAQERLVIVQDGAMRLASPSPCRQ